MIYNVIIKIKKEEWGGGARVPQRRYGDGGADHWLQLRRVAHGATISCL